MKVEKHPGPFSGLDAELARACAMAVIEWYGTDDAITMERIRKNGIWNDHIAVQAALAAIHHLKNYPPPTEDTVRTITDHVANPVNDRITITAMDEPGAGGAHHYYAVDVDGGENGLDIKFQNGPIAENGVNGVTQEVLLAVVIDRLRSFQAGPFACAENAAALGHAIRALDALKSRTLARMARGVEGRSVV